jgi:hypothetical protein
LIVAEAVGSVLKPRVGFISRFAALIAFARRCEGRFRRRIPVQEDADRHAELFMSSACQYYAAARFAMHAQCMPVCGNLFHHTVEMILKGGLARKRKLSDLKGMGHKLKVLWRAYKADFPDPALKRHDKTISGLDKFDDIRYPDAILKHGMGATAEWSGPAGKVTAYGGIKTPKLYTLVVSDIDDLIADAFKMSSWNPGVFIGTNPAALEAITRYNDHSEFLTKR